jgi:hypothetical protein
MALPYGRASAWIPFGNAFTLLNIFLSGVTLLFRKPHREELNSG